MASIADLLAATPAEIVVEVNGVLPSGWGFAYGFEPGGYFAGSIVDHTGVQQWSDAQLDERLLLFNAFGWVTSRGNTPRHPAWVRGPALSSARRGFGISGGGTQDPGDLDPGEVEAVYRAVDDASE